ncbi:MAG: haloacid dehalogenase [Rhizobiaceae bacterium]|nr:MAG: haloacid dehalogenase [Rhizobiaceae bacterium]
MSKMPPPPAHSIWLKPAVEDLAMLTGIVDRLAEEFGSPRFQPHLTLVEDMARPAEELAPLVAEVAAAIPPFSAPVVEIGMSDLFFRSFYARFDAAGPLLELKKRAIGKIAASPIDAFMPHISLAYGLAEGPARSEARGRIAQFLNRRCIHFSTVAVVFSSKEIPIADWEVREEVRLG